MSAADTLALTRAFEFAARAHANQRRKGAAQEPYVNHLAEVAGLVAEATEGADVELVIGALLHDVVEDTAFDIDDLERAFGARVAGWVAENSDDMSLPKPERKRRRLEQAPHKSPGAKLVKIADLISNLRATAKSPPAGWPAEWALGYIRSCRDLHDAMRGANAVLDRRFEAAAAEAEAGVAGYFGRLTDGSTVEFELDASVGQRVHVLYLANTEGDAATPLDRDRLVAIVEARFPSFTLINGEGVFEGRRRPVLIVRLRSDSTDAVVATAQELCIDLQQRFVGIETDGRYLRVYADDTG